ncbi:MULTISPECIES: MerR family transcriptional regulator [Pseudoalteromonas]|uniref:Transcriptional regulator n=1 Tax=Pseudoalteromonas fuliginea TaxID=1872678 RepID=A0AB73BF99_9GAMM|nr:MULTISPECIES: MerR family transcriptional regulator [Pseudoalteromonas]ALQ07936.1 transcriptional regulator [Pseudoalteromonas sp. Bsw20308]KAA1159362.1 MerR family transcriptional regulator [Pseudoalteromonas fuliginea]KDC52303.1 transcriptional regulator [Pseudoalteromonas fuliginea]KDC55907.1 transcriptional regulator [Pseudoalteromonas sp. S3431]KJZ27150.1 transcriptional regulator [Pseudoalteromonas fuliginea]
MYIGEASKKTGLSIKAIRFYEEKGLIRQPERKGRYRVYDETDIELLILIKEAKDLGITLSKLRGVIVYNDNKVDWKKIKQFLSEIRKELISKIEDINKQVNNIDKCYNQINP